MKNLLAATLVAVLTISVGMSTAEARRMGGGGSFGKQSQSVNRQATPPSQTQAAKPAAAPQNAAGATAGAAAAKPASPWRGMLGGALLGLGLGALLSHLGLSGAMASLISSILMIALLALAAMFIYRMVKRKSGNDPARPAFAGAAPANLDMPAIGSRLNAAQPAAFSGSALATGTATEEPAGFGIPADFDTTSFLRHAKTYFIRLQAAWDRADINDIREFTTPEMFAEVRMQLQERGASPNHTDVVSLDAELLGIETVGNDYLASVRFNGMIKESEQAPAEAFAEVWNLSKPVNGDGGWQLAGIQQVQ